MLLILRNLIGYMMLCIQQHFISDRMNHVKIRIAKCVTEKNKNALFVLGLIKSRCNGDLKMKPVRANHFSLNTPFQPEK